ncbi:hypothetical protein PMG11_11091 [Penicillium brasilianum]|uniref:Uncharacterized protein n=1 Tax=Penicillium brasilianum TaxID=104259 RepID=A0A0F7U0Y6_PENBI|nr:hypothetical protein PMG11_11091 [Penicillium brasilianum]
MPSEQTVLSPAPAPPIKCVACIAGRVSVGLVCSSTLSSLKNWRISLARVSQSALSMPKLSGSLYLVYSLSSWG